MRNKLGNLLATRSMLFRSRLRRSSLLQHLLLGVALLVGRMVSAQELGAWHIMDWQADDGLPDNVVRGIAQAPDGCLLVGTRGGLVKLDGAQVRPVAVNAGLSVTESVDAVQQGPDGTLWVLGKQLTAFRKGTEAVTLPLARDRGRVPNAFFTDKQGVLWIGINSGQVSYVKEDVVHPAEMADSLGRASLRMISRDHEGQIWGVGSGALARWIGSVFEKQMDVNPEADVLAAASAGLWIGARRQVFSYHEGKIDEVCSLPGTGDAPDISILLEDQNGGLWIGAMGDGLYYWQHGTLQRVLLPNPDLTRLYEDVEGSIWVGTESGGLCRLRPQVLMTLKEPGSPENRTANSLCVDSRGDVWVVLRTGELYTRRSGHWLKLTAMVDWPGTVANAVVSDAAGQVWITTNENHIVRWDGREFASFPLPESSAGKRVLAMLCAGDGKLWLGQNRQLTYGHPGEWKTISLAEGMGYVQYLVEDKQQVIRGGSRTGPMWQVEGEGIRVIDAPELEHLQGTRTMLSDETGALWIGTTKKGLARVKDGECRMITMKQGLRSDTIIQLILDQQQRLWACTPIGIMMVKLDELNAVADGRQKQLHCTVYGREEGLHNLQASTGYQPVNAIDQKGNLWFAMHGGITIANPAVAGVHLKPPVVTLQAVQADGRQTMPNAKGLLTAGPGVQDLRFELGAASFVDPGQVRLEHRLLGWDRQVHRTDHTRTVTYGALPPGTYRLWARAANHNGVWSAGTELLTLQVRPYYWQTAWFRTMMLLGIMGATAGGVTLLLRARHRRQTQELRRVAAVHSERTRIARDMHDELGASLTQIALISERGRSSSKPDEHLSQLARTAREAVTALDEIVWAVDPKHDTLESLLDYLSHQTSEILSAAGIRCRLRLPVSPPVRHLSAEFRHHFSLIIREAVNNAVKHSQATELLLEIQLTDNGLKASVTDNGVGLQEAASGRHGLENMKQRAVPLRGVCHIESAPGKGTTITVEAPWPDEATPGLEKPL